MKKNDLLNFVNRYHLAGATTSVKWKGKDGNLQTSFITDDQNVIGEINSNNLNFGDNDLGVYATPQLTKMLTAVGDSLDIKVNTIDDKSVSVDIKDKDVRMKFMLADLSVIRQVPDLKQLPDWDVTIDLTTDFVNKFVKAKNAIPESENFAIRANGVGTEIMVNYSAINTNRITFSADATVNKEMATVCFSSNLFKEILQANKDAETAKLEVSAAGLARATFTSKTFDSTYYLVQLQTS